MKTARQVAAEALGKMERDDAWSNLTIDKYLEQEELSSQDRQFCTALFYGVLVRRSTIDACIEKHSNMTLSKMDSKVKSILRCAVYQLLYMDSVPDHAAVSEAVNLTKKMGRTSASSFVNGNLRSFLRTGKKIPLPTEPESAKFSVAYSCHEELAEYLLQDYDKETLRKILIDSLTPPPTFVRVNTLKTTAEDLMAGLSQRGFQCELDLTLPNCIRVEGKGTLLTTEEYQQGLFHFQDRSSQLCALSLEVQKGWRILDCCAAPGSKTITIVEELKKSGTVVACDLYERRVEQMEERFQRMGIQADCKVLDMSEPHPELGEFDGVLCDVPCSGLGVLRRRPEIKYKDISSWESLPEIQSKLLEQAAAYCKKGGILIYSTCTILSTENQKVVENFLKNHPEFTFDSLPYQEENMGMKTILPGENGGDGFFIARMKKTK